MARYVPRLYSSLPLHGGLRFEPDQAHYLISVLRVQKGDPVIVFDGQTGEWNCSVKEVSKKEIALQVVDLRRPQPVKFPRRNLIFSPLKGKAMDILIEKSVELGVSDFYPVYMDFTQGRDLKVEKIHKQIIEASEQCERLTLPTIHEPTKLDSFLSNWDSPLIVGDERGKGTSFIQILKNSVPENITFLIGPEGGFSPREFELMDLYSSIHKVSLGPQILRAETAALTFLGTCLQYFDGFFE